MNNKTSVFLYTLLLTVLYSFTAATAEAPPELVDIQHVAQSASSEQVKIKLNGSYIPKAFILKDETPRIVFDFADMKQGNKVNSSTATNGSLIKRIRVGMHTDNQLKTRVVFDMATLSGVRYVQSFDDKTNTLLISITRGEAEAAPSAQKTQEKAEKESTPAPPTAEQTKVKAQTKSVPEQPLVPAETTKAVADDKPAATPEEVAAAPKKDAEPQAPLPPLPATPASEQPTKSVKPPATTEPQAETAPAAAGSSNAVAPTQKQEKQAGSAPAVQPATPAKETAATKESAPADTGKSEAAPPAPQTPPPPQADTKQKEAAQPAASGPVVESIEFDGKSPKGEMVMFKLNDFHPPAIHGVEEGIPRVICDFDKAQLASTVKNLIKTDGKFVKVIRVAKNKKPERVRVVIDLEPKLSYDLQQVFFKEDKLFVIIVNTMKK